MRPAMCGSATLAMLVSSTSINAARETTTPMSHGLICGSPLAVSVETTVVLLIGISFPACPGDSGTYVGEQVISMTDHSSCGRSTPCEQGTRSPYDGRGEFHFTGG